MRNTEEQLREILERSRKIQNTRRFRRGIILNAASICACLVLIVSTALFLPGTLDPASADTTSYGSLILSGPLLGYVVMGFLAFALGVCVTLLCYRIRVREGKDQS